VADIAVDIADRVMTITLDRPDRLNAFTVAMQRELCAAFDQADSDPDVRVVVVTGRGRGFCAGADLGGGDATFDVDAASEAAGSSGPRRPHRDEGGLVTLRIFQCTKPVIAAINGPAVGVGATMTLPMDLRLASDSAKFGFVFARRGLVPEAASSWFLPRVVGINTALEWTSPVGCSPPQRRSSGAWCDRSTRRTTCSRPPTRSRARSPPARRRSR
jgi:enoyl-CoA hydratase/carnithine racemase